MILRRQFHRWTRRMSSSRRRRHFRTRRAQMSMHRQRLREPLLLLYAQERMRIHHRLVHFLQLPQPREFFVQQSLRRFHQRLRVETPLHRRVAQHVRHRQQDHSLMMRHPAAHQLVLFPFTHPRTRKIRRFEKSMRAHPAHLFHPPQIFPRARRVHQQAQERRVRRNHQLWRARPIHRQPRHTKRVVPVKTIRVLVDARTLRYSPGHPGLPRVFLLRPHRALTTPLKNRVRIAFHPQRR